MQYSQGDDDVIQASHPSNYLIVSTGRILQLQVCRRPNSRSPESLFLSLSEALFARAQVRLVVFSVSVERSENHSSSVRSLLHVSRVHKTAFDMSSLS